MYNNKADNYSDINSNNNNIRKNEPYNRNINVFENSNKYNRNYERNDYNISKSTNFSSPLKASSNLFMRPTKTKRFQNENLVVYRVSPYHYQYRYKLYDDINYRNIEIIIIYKIKIIEKKLIMLIMKINI